MIEIAVIVSDIEAMPSFDGDLVHFVGDRVISIPAKRSTQVLITKCVPASSRRAEQLIDVALAITNMNAPSPIAQQLCGVPDIVQPSNALLFLDGNARRIDLLKRGGPLEFLAGPEV